MPLYTYIALKLSHAAAPPFAARAPESSDPLGSRHGERPFDGVRG